MSHIESSDNCCHSKDTYPPSHYCKLFAASFTYFALPVTIARASTYLSRIDHDNGTTATGGVVPLPIYSPTLD